MIYHMIGIPKDVQNFYRHILKSKNKIKYIKYHKIESVIQQKCLVEMYLDNEVWN